MLIGLHQAFSHESMDFRADLFSEKTLVTAFQGMVIEQAQE